MEWPTYLDEYEKLIVRMSTPRWHLEEVSVEEVALEEVSLGCRFHLSLAAFLKDIVFVFQVLVSAVVSAAIGQLTKPFASTILYGKKFDIKTCLQSGGFPSTHSSSVVATATCLAMERGFSDALFDLAVIYAGLIMYDAQGVRREVGAHARVLNKVLSSTTLYSPSSTNDANDLVNSYSRESSSNIEITDSVCSEEHDSLQKKPTSSLLLKPDNQMQPRSSGAVSETSESVASSLNESIEHTKIEVQSHVQVQLKAHLEEQKKGFEQMLTQFSSGSGPTPPS